MTKRVLIGLFAVLAATLLPVSASAQIDKICGETGGSVWLNSSAVFGKISLRDLDSGGKFPKVTVILTGRNGNTTSYTVDRSGNYCFPGADGSGATLSVEVEGREVVRQVLPSSTYLKQYQQDFDVLSGTSTPRNKPASVSVKFQYQRNEQNAKLFEEASNAAADNKPDKAAEILRKIVESDPADYMAWSQIGAIYYEKKQYANAEKAYTAALTAKPELAPAMMNLGRIHLVNGKIEPAIDMLKRSTEADPALARAFQLLGEAYLLARKGTLGVEALNEAIRLEPVGMAESHLLLATLYDRAGAKFMATREYKMFIEKIPDHKDAKKFKRYIDENPDSGQ
jgi:Tfp pilus assembly protein PilF